MSPSPKVLILTGSTETARTLVVEELLDAHKDWKHLMLEEIANEQEEGSMQEGIVLMVACECAKEEYRKGYNVVITMPSLHMLDVVADAFPQGFIAVHLGKKGAKPSHADHVIDTAKASVMETFEVLETIIAR